MTKHPPPSRFFCPGGGYFAVRDSFNPNLFCPSDRMKLFYCSKAQYGGWISFTAHLALTTGYQLYKPSKINSNPRSFGYGTDYCLIKDISGDCLITAIDKHYYSFLPFFPEGTHLVIHDPTELTTQLLPHLSRFKIITIRPLVQTLLRERHNISSTLLLHPFHLDSYPSAEKTKAVSISRIDFDKHTHIILKANQLMDNPIALYGAVNRLYVFHQLRSLGFNDHYRGTFAKTKEALKKILADAKYVVDMSLIKNDGGGSQYTFLEAIAAGCVLVLHRGWLRPGGEFVEGYNCLAAASPEELKAVLEKEHDLLTIRQNASALLKRHTEESWLFPTEKDFQPILDELKRRPIALNNYRNIAGNGRSQAFGVVGRRCLNPDYSRQCWQRPYLYKLLLDYGQKFVKIPWTSVTVNDNYSAAPHRDRGNVGQSYLVGFGDYTGGALSIHEGDLSGSHLIRHNPLITDFSKVLHSVQQWEGQRYSLIFYTAKGSAGLPSPSVRLVDGKWLFFRGDEHCVGLPHPLKGRTVGITI